MARQMEAEGLGLGSGPPARQVPGKQHLGLCVPSPVESGMLCFPASLLITGNFECP